MPARDPVQVLIERIEEVMSPGLLSTSQWIWPREFVSLRLSFRAALKRGLPDSATSTADVDVLGMDLPPFNFLFWSRYRARL